MLSPSHLLVNHMILLLPFLHHHQNPRDYHHKITVLDTAS
jgi:hypothetical protein